MTRVPNQSTPEMPPLGCHLHDWNIAARASAGSKGTRPTGLAGSVGARAFQYGLIVDLDDTLYEREQFVHSGLMAVARYVQEHRSVSAMDAFAAMTAARRTGAAGRELQALCARFGWSEDEVPLLLEVFREHRPVLRLPGETVRALSQVRADGWRIVVLTNGLPCVQRGKVSALGLGAFVDAVVCAEEHAPGGKPARAAFRAALATLSMPADRCVCVGDDAVCDIAGAQAMGIRAVWIKPGLGARGPGFEGTRDSGLEGTRESGLGVGGSVLDEAQDSTRVPDAQIASIGDLPLALAELMEMVKTDAA